MTEETMNAEARKRLELILAGKHPDHKVDGLCFIDEFDTCVNEQRVGLSKIPLIQPSYMRQAPLGQDKRLLVVKLVDGEVVNAEFRNGWTWDSVSHQAVVSDNEVFNGRGEGVKAMIQEWAKGAKE